MPKDFLYKDSVEYRTGGMKRVGYDADTGKYYFQSPGGTVWEGQEGAEFGGEMRSVGRQVGSSSTRDSADAVLGEEGDAGESGAGDDEEAAGKGSDLESKGALRSDGYQPLPMAENAIMTPPRNRDAYRTMLPFFLVVCVFLLLVIRLVATSSVKPAPPPCPQHSRPYEIKSGDTCWAIAKDYGTNVDSLRTFNPSLDCAKLKPGQNVCVPVKD